MTLNRIGVIGAGAWGTALAAAARANGRDVVLWALEPEVADAVNGSHENSLYLPGVPLDAGIRATTNLTTAVDADAVLLVAPAQHLRRVCTGVRDAWKPGTPAVICAKGIEQKTCALMSEAVADALPGVPLAVLSGPTFAKEVAAGLPSAVTLACPDADLDRRLADALGRPQFRTYRSEDLVGAQIGGAVKNVLAIGCGIVEGRGMGDNARAALITRGLTEMTRIALAKGGHLETMMGLSGIGDLVLTCNAMQSRNFSLGVALGQGQSLSDVLGARTSVAEGVFTSSSVAELGRKLGVETPICSAVDRILNGGENIDTVIAGLLARPTGEEFPADMRS